MLIELEHKEKLPRRLVAAVPSMFATAAGQRYIAKRHYWSWQEEPEDILLCALIHRVVELLCFLACHALGQQLQQHFPSELQHVQVQHGQGESSLYCGSTCKSYTHLVMYMSRAL